MNRNYFLIISLGATFVALQSNVIDDVKNWWQSLTEQKKQKVREAVQDETYKTYNPQWVWDNLTEPQTNKAYDYLKQRITSDSKWVAGAAAVGAATYGLYRWAMRRGLGGITNDFKLIDAKYTDIFYQIDKKYADLILKKSLTDVDKSLINGLCLLIGSKITSTEKRLEELKIKHEQLKKIIQPNNEENKDKGS